MAELLSCVFCKQSDRILKLFTKETLRKCRLILKHRKEHNLKFKDVILPDNEYKCGYHRHCYKLFTALMRKYYLPKFSKNPSKPAIQDILLMQKRKRTGNTTPQQYELYLNYCEKYLSPKNMVENTNLDEDFSLLTNNLNSLQGPKLSTEQWIKRFLDWKYQCINKKKKIDNYYNKNGNNTPCELKLTPFEVRFLEILEKSNEPRLQSIGTYNVDPLNFGIVKEETEIVVEEETILDSSNLIPLENEPESASTMNMIHVKPILLLNQELLETDQLENDKSEENNSEKQQNNNKYYKANSISLLKEYIEVKKERNRIEKKKLEFEYLKFKHLHPDFKHFYE